MTLPKALRHVQTQHGNPATVDVENIFLFPANLNCTSNAASAAGDATETATEAASTATTSATAKETAATKAEDDETGSSIAKSEEANGNVLNGVWTYEANEDDGIQVSLTGLSLILQVLCTIIVIESF